MKVLLRAELHYCEVKKDGKSEQSVCWPHCLPLSYVFPEHHAQSEPAWRGGNLSKCISASSGDHRDLAGEIGRLRGG